MELYAAQTSTVKGYVTILFNKTGTANRLALTLQLLELTRTILRGKRKLKLLPVQEWAQRRRR